ncbi:hypothetical protein Pfo_028393 [Paulownia fortunei]|nr:hypothetical protein Pfo_028393 [Paulownia fortunei]
MNQGVVQSSPVQQMVAAGSPNWWSINSMQPPPHHQHHSFLAALPHNHLSHHLTPPLMSLPSSWNDCQDLPESWSQLLLGGLVGEEDKPGMSHMQPKKLENWEQLLLNQTSNSCGGDAKQENSATSYTYGPGNVEFQAAKSTNCWSPLMVSASSPKSCVTTLSSNMFDFSHKSSEHCHRGAAKKARIQTSSAQSAIKERKIGDRITALHQLVSPFGKTDTASVLLEAIGYIRFLQSQIEALSLPYLGSGSGNMRRQQPVHRERTCLFPEDPGQLLNEKYMKRKAISEQESDEEPKKDLKSRGLCLVPISCTVDVGSEDGADYWAPAFGGNFQ